MLRRPVLLTPALVVFVLVAVAAGCATSSDKPSDADDVLPTQTATPVLAPAPTWATVTAPEATAVGRSDCPGDWLAYDDPDNRYSICYPGDARVSASDLALNVRGPQPASQQNDGFTVFVSWSEVTSFGASRKADAETCQGQFVMGQKASSLVELTVSGSQMSACFAHGATDDGIPLGSLVGDISLAADGSKRDGFLNLRLDFGGPSAPEIPPGGQAILDTLVVNVR